MKTFRFVDFQVYKDSKRFYSFCITSTRHFSRDYWELRDQLCRASLSICLNIAEGSAKYSDKDFKRFIETALGSANESYSCLEISFEHRLLAHDGFSEGKTLLESITLQLGGLSKKLRQTC